jgi:hypothetical protein
MAKEVEEEVGVSLDPDTFVEGGGLLDNVDVTWRNPRFEMWSYPSGNYGDAPVFRVDLELDDGSVSDNDVWTAGSADDWSPSKSGNLLKPIGGQRFLSRSSNFFQLLKSLKEAKFPNELMEAGKASVYEGLKCHMVRINQPERKGLAKKDKKYTPSVLVVDTIIQLPGEKGKASEKKGASDNLSEKATQVVMEILADNPKGIQKMKLASQAFAKLKAEKVDQTTINAIVQLIGGKDEGFISSGPWTYEKGLVSQG